MTLTAMHELVTILTPGMETDRVSSTPWYSVEKKLFLRLPIALEDTPGGRVKQVVTPPQGILGVLKIPPRATVPLCTDHGG